MIPLRDENPTRTVPYVTYGLIAANVIVWLLEFFGGLTQGRGGMGGWMAGLTMIPAEIVRGIDIGQVNPAYDLNGADAASDLADRLHQYVFARRSAALGGEHAVPIHLRQQYRGCAGKGEVLGVLSALRGRGGGIADSVEHEFANSNPWGIGGNCGRTRCVPDFVSAGTG